MCGQLDIFNIIRPEYKITKPIRLIELFAGIGAQAMALRDLGADFEHYRAIELDRFALASYNAIHGTAFAPADIRQTSGADLGITDTGRWCYIVTYSFPCQDLSVCGKKKGMKKGSGTRSGLLWEVERLMNETGELPQVLLMENVPQVHGKKNMPDFQKWITFLEGKGYSNYWQDLNAKDYGIAQNRNRCFMVSLLGEWGYKFPEPRPLTKKLADYLESDADEKYYINTDKARRLIGELAGRGQLGGTELVDLTVNSPEKRETANCITGRENRSVSERRRTGNGVIGRAAPLNAMPDGTCRAIKSQYYKNSARNFVDARYGATGAIQPNRKERRLGNLYGFSGGNYAGNVYGVDAPAPTLNASRGGGTKPMIVRSVERNPDSPTCRTPGIPTTQRIEPNSRGICNTLSTVQKDNLLLEPPYRIRKLTPRECWRLMGFCDRDFDKAAAVGSDTQLYKQAGNSIVKDVLIAIFAQMIGGD